MIRCNSGRKADSFTGLMARSRRALHRSSFRARSTRSFSTGAEAMRSLDIAGTGMQAQQTNVEVISNNIANMTTTGFKRRRAEFQDLIYQNLRRVGSNSSDSGSIVPAGAQ